MSRRAARPRLPFLACAGAPGAPHSTPTFEIMAIFNRGSRASGRQENGHHAPAALYKPSAKSKARVLSGELIVLAALVAMFACTGT